MNNDNSLDCVDSDKDFATILINAANSATFVPQKLIESSAQDEKFADVIKYTHIFEIIKEFIYNEVDDYGNK